MIERQTTLLLVLHTKHACLLAKYTIVYLQDTLGQSKSKVKSYSESISWELSLGTKDLFEASFVSKILLELELELETFKL